MQRKILNLLVLCTPLLLAAPAARAANINWTNAAGGDWSTAANWSPNTVPGGSDQAIISMTGTYTVTLDEDATISALTLGGASGIQTFAFSGQRSLTLNGDSTVNSNAVFSMSSGGGQNRSLVVASGTLTLGGSGSIGGDVTVNNLAAVNVTGSYSLNAGVTFAGAGALNIQPGATLQIGGSASKNFDGFTLNNSGLITLNGDGAIGLLNEATFNNLAGGTFNVENFTAPTGISGSGTLNNGGTLNIQGPGGRVAFAMGHLNNSGQFNVFDSIAQASLNNTTTGGFFVNAGAEIEFVGSFNFNPGTTFTGDGLIRVNPFEPGFAITVNTSLTIPNLHVGSFGVLNVASGTLTVSNGTSTGSFTVAAGAALSFRGAFSWNAGTFAGAGAFNIQPGATLQIGGDSNKKLDGTLNNSGLITLSGDGAIGLLNEATFNNLAGGTFNVGNFTAPKGISGSGTFNNAGTLNIQTPGGRVAFHMDHFNNSGQVNMYAGVFCASLNRTTTGGFFVAAGAEIEFRGNFNFNPGTSFTGDGLVRVNPSEPGFAIIVNTSLNIANLHMGNFGVLNVASGTLTVNNSGTSAGRFDIAAGAAVQFTRNFSLNAGTIFTGEGVVRLAPLAVSDGIAVNGTITIPQVELAGAGAVTVQSGTLTLVSSAANVSRFNVAAGAALALEAGSYEWPNGGIAAGAVFNVGSNAVLTLSGSADKILNGTLNNFGLVNWTNAGRLVSDGSGAVFNNYGVVDAQGDGEMRLGPCCAPTAEFNNLGTFRKTSGATFTIFTRNFRFNSSGLVEVRKSTLILDAGGTSSGTFQVAAGATLIFGNSAGATPTTLSADSAVSGAGSVVIGNGAVVIDGAYNVAGFTDISSGIVRFNTAASTGSGALGAAVLAGTGSLAVSGTFDWTGGGSAGTLMINSGGTLNLRGSSDKTLDGTVRNAGTTFWTGTGRIRSNGGGLFENEAGGLFEAQNDSAFLLGPCCEPTATFNNAGTFRKSGGTTSTVFTRNFRFNNSGIVDVQNSTLILDGGGTSTGAFHVASGATLIFGNSLGATPTTLEASSSVSGAGSVIIANGNVVINGTYNVAGFTDISGGIVRFNTAASTGSGALGAAVLAGTGSLAVSGTFDWTQGGSAGTLIINPGGTLNLSGSSDKTLDGTVRNGGTTFWTGTGRIRSNGGGLFENEAGGLFELQNDSAFLLGPCCEPTATFNNAGTFRKTTSTGGTAFGNRFRFLNSGSVELRSGFVQIIGDYNPTAASSLAVSLAGTNVNEFGRLLINGRAALNGTLRVQLANGFVPSLGDRFEILTFGSRIGDFSATSGLNIGGGKQLETNYTATALTLVVTNAVVEELPSLSITHSNDFALVSWPTQFTGFRLEGVAQLGTNGWVEVAITEVNKAILPATNGNRFFRLIKP